MWTLWHTGQFSHHCIISFSSSVPDSVSLCLHSGSLQQLFASFVLDVCCNFPRTFSSPQRKNREVTHKCQNYPCCIFYTKQSLHLCPWLSIQTLFLKILFTVPTKSMRWALFHLTTFFLKVRYIIFTLWN